jgi:hypothetical protein
VTDDLEAFLARHGLSAVNLRRHHGCRSTAVEMVGLDGSIAHVVEIPDTAQDDWASSIWPPAERLRWVLERAAGEGTPA